jgi:integrase
MASALAPHEMSEPHIVPLSRQAADILREIQLLSGRERWVFPQLRNPRNANNAAAKARIDPGCPPWAHEVR